MGLVFPVYNVLYYNFELVGIDFASKKEAYSFPVCAQSRCQDRFIASGVTTKTIGDGHQRLSIVFRGGAVRPVLDR